MLRGPSTWFKPDFIIPTRHQPAVTSIWRFQHVWMEVKLSRGSAGKLAAVCKLNEPRPLSRRSPFTSATHKLPLSLRAPSHCAPPPPPLCCHSAVITGTLQHTMNLQPFSSSNQDVVSSQPLRPIWKFPSQQLFGGARGCEGLVYWHSLQLSASDKTFPHYKKYIQQIKMINQRGFEQVLSGLIQQNLNLTFLSSYFQIKFSWKKDQTLAWAALMCF